MTNSTQAPVDDAIRRAIRGTRDLRIPVLRDPLFVRDRNLVVRAGAGSGKTSALIERMVALVRSGEPVQGLAAITFTLKAAGEMRARFFEELTRADRKLAQRIEESDDVAVADAFRQEHGFVRVALGGIDELFIDTIHAFCSSLLRERPFEAGLTPDFSLADDQDEDRLRIRFWNRYLSDHLKADDAWTARFDDLGVDPGSLAGFFGARCRFQDVALASGPAPRPDLTDATSEAQRFLDRLLPLLPVVGTHSDAILMALWKAHRYRGVVSLSSDAERFRFLTLFDGLVSSDGVSLKNIVLKRWGAARDVAQMLKKNEGDGALADLVREQIRPVVRAWRRMVYEAVREFVEPAVAEFARFRKQEGRQTFDDLLLSAAQLLREYPSVRAHFRSRYPRLLVDEFQDTDPVQAEVLFLLTSEEADERDWTKCRPFPGSLFIVGDAKQSIYRFRRADVQVYDRCCALVESTGGQMLDLVTNFRSDARICSWVNGKLAPAFQLDTAPWQAHYEDLQPFRSNGDHAVAVVQMHVGKVHRNHGGLIAQDDSRQVANAISALISSSRLETDQGPVSLVPIRYGDCMVLLRASAEVPHYARALDALGIPYSIAGGKTLGNEPVLAALNDLLACALNPHDQVRVVAVLRGPWCAASDVDLLKHVRNGGRFKASSADAEMDDLPEAVRDGLGLIRSARKAIRRRTPSEGLGELLHAGGLLAAAAIGPDGATAAGALIRIHALVRDWDGNGQSWPEIIRELGRLESGAFQRDGMTPESGGDAVRIMMVHQAKGLQAPVVFLAMPSARTRGLHDVDSHVERATDPAVALLPVTDRLTKLGEPPDWDQAAEKAFRFETAEEIRLVYVAATRAEDLLVVSRYPEKDAGPWAPLYRDLSVPILKPAPLEVSLGDENAFDRAMASVQRSDRALKLRRGHVLA